MLSVSQSNTTCRDMSPRKLCKISWHRVRGMFARWLNMDLPFVIAHSASRIWINFFRTDKYDFGDVEMFKAILKELGNMG